MIRDVALWLAVADLAASAAFAALVYAAGRRSPHPVPGRTALGLVALLALPGVVVYGLVWAFGG